MARDDITEKKPEEVLARLEREFEALEQQCVEQRRSADDQRRHATDWESRAKSALQSADEATARQALVRQEEHLAAAQQATQEAEALESARDSCRSAVTALRDRLSRQADGSALGAQSDGRVRIAGRFEFDSMEYYRALRAMLRRNPVRWVIPIMGIFVPGYFIWTYVISIWDRVSLSAAVANGLPWVLLGAFYLSLVPLMNRRSARRALKNNPSLRGPQTRVVDERGLEIQGANFLQRLSWTDIVRTDETEEFFLFFYNQRMAFYVPKRCLSETDIEIVRSLISAHGKLM